MKNKAPILFIIFNKISETQQVFEIIRQQQPEQLFIAADGPRENKLGEAEKCQYIRQWVLDHIDWTCEVKTLFRNENIGCGRGPSEAITWFFEHVEEGIILEDDCLPNESFFLFCEELLDKYRNNSNISIISGNNFQKIQPMSIEEDYYFSVFPSSNGWATWRRSWEGYDYRITSWPKQSRSQLRKFLFSKFEYGQWWVNYFDWLYTNKPEDMWDFQFHYHTMMRKQWAVIPKANLVKNIGYGLDATHSQDPNSYFANVPTYEFEFPLRHPAEINRNYGADEFIQSMLFGQAEVVSTYKKIKRYIKKLVRYTPL